MKSNYDEQVFITTINDNIFSNHIKDKVVVVIQQLQINIGIEETFLKKVLLVEDLEVYYQEIIYSMLPV